MTYGDIVFLTWKFISENWIWVLYVGGVVIVYRTFKYLMKETEFGAYLKRVWVWYLQTSMLVGLPVAFFLILGTVQGFVFTGSCFAVGKYCEYAWSADRTAEAIQAFLDANPGRDLAMPPTDTAKHKG